MEYVISGTTKRRVEFACPNCRSPLECPLSDAGQQFPCPTCAAIFTVPGGKEYADYKSIEMQREKAQSVRRERESQARRKAVEELTELESQPAIRPSIPKIPASRRYDSITTGSAMLSLVGGAMGILASLSAVGGVICIARFVVSKDDSFFIAIGGEAIATALVLLIISLLLKMVASVAIAIRDIAINSFGEEP